MTLDVRKIVETLRDNPDSFWDAQFIYPLINALVEEKHRSNKLVHAADHRGSSKDEDGSRRDWTEKDWYKVVFQELGLDGVWPVKEKTNVNA